MINLLIKLNTATPPCAAAEHPFFIGKNMFMTKTATLEDANSLRATNIKLVMMEKEQEAKPELTLNRFGTPI